MDATFEAILRAAFEAGASDIHLKPNAPVVVRIDRELVAIEAPQPTEAWVQTILSGIVPAHARQRLSEDHEADFAFTLAGVGRFRTNVYHHRGQPALALRLVRKAVRTFADLALPEAVRNVADAPRGIVVIAGATGSGKSTTLAAIVEHINATARRHILTLEDPIEFLFEDRQSIIEQREIGIDTASYKSGLRHVLRQDPDVIVIGEMRDAESAAAAMSAANIGHLVVTTLHTSNAVQSVQRIVEFFPEGERDYARRLFAVTLRGVICQRLVSTTTGSILPAVEILLNNAAVAQQIADNKTDKLQGLIELNHNDGMQTFDQSLVALVQAGRISREEAVAHAGNPDLLRMGFQGVVLSESHRIMKSRG
jgi:twitching motility protein PilT